MAANNDIAAPVSFPAIAYDASIGTTWQEFTLPTIGNPSKVTVQATGALYLAFDADGAVDTGAVGNKKFAVDATNAAAGIEVSLTASRAQRTESIFVAAQSGTITDVRVVVE